MGTMRVTAAAGADFAEVYQEQLAPVWRYVRSRIWSYHDAQDVTAEVFTRAWRSWPRYDPRRGGVAPWLFRIAQRTVVDWLRRHGDELPRGRPSFDPGVASVSESLDAVLLDKDVLVRLGWALAELNERDRNCVALRFAGGLKIAEVAEVLGMSTAATKMALSRAITRLADSMARLEERESEALAPVDLAGVIEELVVDGYPSIASEKLQELIVHLSAAHQPALPRELPGRVADCVACVGRATTRDEPVAGTAVGRRNWLAERLGLAPFTGLTWTALAPVCLACTLPLMLAPFLALGLGLTVSVGLHLIALATAPLVVAVLWRHFGRHRDRLAVYVGAAGALLLVVHLGIHLIPGAEGAAPLAFVISDQVGTGLLLAGAFLDWRAMRRWIADQRSRSETVGSLAPAATGSASG
jgi:RNA polymerase sigma factor (sigma-70 family)